MYGHNDISDEIKNKLRDINDFFTSNQFSFREDSYSLTDLRDEETHYLNPSDIPRETVFRMWRKFYELVATLDPNIFEYTKNRPELRDFYYLQDFFKKVVLDGNLREEITKHGGKVLVRIIDLDKIRRDEEGRERGIYEIIEFIKSEAYTVDT